VNVCSDPDDDKFLELALEAKATYLITGNTEHFPSEPYKGIRIVSPAEFLKLRS
jgi:predicted nucleic acid-binding protein